MLVNDVIERVKRKKYFLILILLIIILLLILLIGTVSSFNKKNIVSQDEQQSKEEEEMIVAIENKQKEEEQKQKEKLEEANATGIIYLTFDDGPTQDTTPKILNILKKKNIKATFFVVNYSDANEKLIRQEAEMGETIALHGYTHTYSEVYQSSDTCIDNFKKIQSKVYQTTGKKANIIRFPGGSSNTISRKYCEGVMTELTKRVVDEGFRYFDWNVDSDDAGKAKTSQDIYNNVISGIKPGRGNVVLMHDFAKNDKTVNALESIIDYGLQNGYVFRKITDETKMVTHSVNN